MSTRASTPCALLAQGCSQGESVPSQTVRDVSELPSAGPSVPDKPQGECSQTVTAKIQAAATGEGGLEQVPLVQPPWQGLPGALEQWQN